MRITNDQRATLNREAVESAYKAIPDARTKVEYQLRLHNAINYVIDHFPSPTITDNYLRRIEFELGELEFPEEYRPANSIQWAVARIRELLAGLQQERQEHGRCRIELQQTNQRLRAEQAKMLRLRVQLDEVETNARN